MFKNYKNASVLKAGEKCGLAQDYADKEVIVVNDGSTDATQAIIERFGTRIRSCYQQNKGLGAARNTGIKMATGVYLAFLDSDDLWEKTKLTTQIAAIDATDPLVFSHVKQFVCPSLSDEERAKIKVNQSSLPGYLAGALVVSKKRLLEVGLFFEEKGLGEFVDWYWRAVAAKAAVVVLPQVMLYRRLHLGNMGRKKRLYSRTDYLKIIKRNLDRRRERATPS
ncbi:MAG: glycosyltransferase family A protein [Chlamydiota bacterium]